MRRLREQEPTYDWVGAEEWVLASPKLTFVDTRSGATVVTICVDPPSIEVNPSLDWNTAAKQFWNAACRVIGKPAVFPDD
jgi:hypothetical protein